METSCATPACEAQLTFATSLGRALLSYNRADFWRLDAAYRQGGRQHGGIITIPQAPPVQRRLVRAALLLDWLGTLDGYRSRLFRWNDLQQSLLGGLRFARYSEEEIDNAVGRSRGV